MIMVKMRLSFEYPVGVYNYDDYEISGGNFEEIPQVGILYSQDECDIDGAYNEFNQLKISY